jgi:orotate phosphoribosyltransferase
MTERERLKEIILKYAYQQREVTLASGRKSDFYFDGKQCTLYPEGAHLVGRLMMDRIQQRFPQTQAVGGPTLGADPIATAVGMVSFSRGTPLATFIVRKSPKGHGTMSWIEGGRHLRPGMRVVLVEDVITTGGSLIKAMGHVREAGLVPIACLTIVDREEGGRENLEGEGLKVESLFTKSELLQTSR